MLSIIVSSYRPQLFESLCANITKTCGVKFQLIKIDNPNKMSVGVAYNLGAKKANYDHLLFIHEDIEFKTINWGKTLLAHFNRKDVGVIGIAGGLYVPAAPCGWYTTSNNALINIIQHEKPSSKKEIKTFKETARKAIALDGVFMAVKKNVFIQSKFNEDLRGYHGYDTDFSLRISKDYQNFVISDVLIEHFSSGNIDRVWLDTNIYIRKKLGSNFNNKIDSRVEYLMYEHFLKLYFDYNRINIINLIKAFQHYPFTKLGYRNFLALLKYVYKKNG